MKAIRHFFAFSLLAALWLLASPVHAAPYEAAGPGKQQTEFAQAQLHAQAFLQPQASHQFVAAHKAHDFMPVDWISRFFGIRTELKLLKTSETFPFQDLDRCETVSRHLFPYHSFW